jgi:hypothetical protein
VSTRGGVRFTEEMEGFVTFGAAGYRTGYDDGRAAGTAIMFHLTIDTGPYERFRNDPCHTGTATGWVGCSALGGDRLPVDGGVFELFAPTATPGRTAMRYRLPFASGTGEPLTLVGFKDIGDDPGFDLWRDTTSLSARVLEGHVDPEGDSLAAERARGMLVIPPRSFARQLTTFRGSPVAMVRFVGLFMATLARTYLGGRRARRGKLTPGSRR